MTITDLFIRRPVLAIVLSLLILLIGFKSFFLLPIRQFPEIDSSIISVTTSYPGASAELMEGFVTSPIENAVASVEGIDYLSSSSSQGNSQITINLKLGYDINKAITDTISKISSVRYLLPAEIKDPIVSKQDPNARPTMYLAFSSHTLSPEQITDYLIRVVQPQIQTLPGVGSAAIYGERLYAMRIWLNPIQMAAHNITAHDVQQSLMLNNQQTAGGRIIGPSQEYNITAQTDLRSANQFNDLIIKQDSNYPVRLREVGYAELGAKNDRSSINSNGKQAVIMGIIPQSTANPLDVSREVNQLLPRLMQQMPKGLQAAVNWDTSKFIRASLKEVYFTIFAAVACVVTVTFLFLGSWRAVLIPMVTIPLSLIGVCSLMLALGYTINTLTLLAWVLAIGLVVDDGIVVLENIHRHMENGMKAMDAALLGAREIRFAIIAMTFTLAAVYAPIGFISGLTGSLFREFAFTLASSVIISGVISLTLSPMMCSRLLRIQHEKARLDQKIDQFFKRLMQRYYSLLEYLLKKHKLIIIVAMAIYLSCFFMYRMLPNELAPSEDQGAILSFISAPTTASLAYTEKYTQELADAFSSLPEKTTFGIINGFNDAVNNGFAYLVLKPWNERKRNADEIIQTLLPQLWAIPGITAFPVNLPSLPGTSEFTPVGLVLKTTGNYPDLAAATEKMLAIARANPALINIDSDLKINRSQINISIDRNKASALGIPMQTIASTLNLLLGEPTVTRFIIQGRSYDVIPQLLPQFMQSEQQINAIQLRAANNSLVPLANIINIKHQTMPDSLNHFQQQRAAKISASLVPGYTLGQALDYLKTAAKKTLSDTIQTDFSGQSRQFIQASGAMLQTFGFALLFIFLVLAAQFESFRDPLIIMLSVPLSLAGALLAMHLTHCTLNIYTQIGLVTLIGLISKHGILIVEFANQLQIKGRNRMQAVLEAASLRLRPILMTTAAMVLGAVPLALASGAGAVSRSQIGWVIIGGMAIGTLFTLFIVPAAYLLFAKEHKSIT